MQFNNPAIREAFRLGVRETLESSFVHLRPSEMRALQQWLIDLEHWEGGDPPPSPQAWGPDEAAFS